MEKQITELLDVEVENSSIRITGEENEFVIILMTIIKVDGEYTVHLESISKMWLKKLGWKKQ